MKAKGGYQINIMKSRISFLRQVNFSLRLLWLMTLYLLQYVQ